MKIYVCTGMNNSKLREKNFDNEFVEKVLCYYGNFDNEFLFPDDLPQGLNPREEIKMRLSLIDSADRVVFPPNYHYFYRGSIDKDYCEVCGKDWEIFEK